MAQNQSSSHNAPSNLSYFIKHVLKLDKKQNLNPSYRLHLKNQLHDQFGLSHKDAERFINVLFDEMIAHLIDQNSLKIPYIGILEIKNTAPRQCRNFKTNQTTMSSAQKTVRFKPSNDFKRHIESKH